MHKMSTRSKLIQTLDKRPKFNPYCTGSGGKFGNIDLVFRTGSINCNSDWAKRPI